MSKLVPLLIGGAVVVAIFSPTPEPAAPITPAPVQTVATLQPAPANSGEIVLTRARDGHFYADAQVNGTVVRFLVDTGASSVALSKADAARIGLQFSDAEFTETGQGAGGRIALKPIMLDRIIIGTTEMAGVEGVIVDSDMKVSLLGQSWLKRVGSVSITGDRMTLK